MDIIDFFRSIDGVVYYVMLAVNTILIFAIIGYLGEQNNKKLIQMSRNTPVHNNKGGMDFSTPVTGRHNDIAMPTVAPTASNNLQVAGNNLDVPNNNMGPAIAVGVAPIPNQNVQPIPNMVQPMMTTGTSPVANTNVQVMPNTMNQNVMGSSTNQPQINNEIDPNEKAPAVLVINSQNTNMPK